MNLVLLSGGSGKRLWPLSNEIRSKQFLRVVKNNSGEVESMLQRVYQQIQSAQISENVLITASKVQYDTIKNQLGDQVSIVQEPERRDTFPAIMLSCAYLVLEQKKPLTDIVTILPVDPYVDIEYFYTIRELEQIILANEANIALMGVKPTYPSEKYGYIIPTASSEKYARVLEFKEKPNQTTAQQYISQGGLWSCGVFSFRLSYIMQLLQKYISFSSYEDVLQQYGTLRKTSFDYEVLEKCSSVVVLPYQGEWKDLGTWNTLTEVMGSKILGNVVVADTCYNTHIINELELPVVAMGTQNLVIVASPDGILVSDKEQSSYLKQCISNIDQRPMYEERSWGEYKVLDLSVGDDGTKALTKRKTIAKGACFEYQIHHNRSEVWIILSGKCKVKINDVTTEASAGDTFSILSGEKHGLQALTHVELLEVQVGKELQDDGTESAEVSRGMAKL